MGGGCQNQFVNQARRGVAPAVWVHFHCSAEGGFDSISKGKLTLLMEYKWARLVSRWVSLWKIVPVCGHHRSFREGLWGSRTLLPADRRRDSTSQLRLLQICCVCVVVWRQICYLCSWALLLYNCVIRDIPETFCPSVLILHVWQSKLARY